MNFRMADKRTPMSKSIATSFLFTQNLGPGELLSVWAGQGGQGASEYMSVSTCTHVHPYVSTHKTGGLWRKDGGTGKRDSK